ncbi:hypothetical protein CHS0354_021385 [Potamilus streckersoni]|uniref:Uncharacterized protein n=1 Tax=Potamilus streckersoni TaxID=2493646 RepID=A0AAE0VMF7_9BIVA|nr:hypothetical protein CHS0354_021385 [Potamilus streckersoni]
MSSSSDNEETEDVEVVVEETDPYRQTFMDIGHGAAMDDTKMWEIAYREHPLYQLVEGAIYLAAIHSYDFPDITREEKRTAENIKRQNTAVGRSANLP